jgi:hypothetical protein
MYRLVKFSPGGGDLADVTVLQPTGHLAIWGILGGCAEILKQAIRFKRSYYFVGLIASEAVDYVAFDVVDECDMVATRTRHYDCHAFEPVRRVEGDCTPPSSPRGCAIVSRWNTCACDETDVTTKAATPSNRAIDVTHIVFEPRSCFINEFDDSWVRTRAWDFRDSNVFGGFRMNKEICVHRSAWKSSKKMSEKNCSTFLLGGDLVTLVVTTLPSGLVVVVSVTELHEARVAKAKRRNVCFMVCLHEHV